MFTAAFTQERSLLSSPHPAPENMSATKFAEFASQDQMKIGMTTIDKIPDNSIMNTTETQSARSSSLSSEASADSGLLPYYFNGAVSPQAAKMFAFAKTLEFARSAHVLSLMKATREETDAELKEEGHEGKSDGQIVSYAESGIGSETKSDGSSDSDEDVIIGETDEQELAQTGKKLVSCTDFTDFTTRNFLANFFLTATFSAGYLGEPATPGSDVVDVH